MRRMRGTARTLVVTAGVVCSMGAPPAAEAGEFMLDLAAPGFFPRGNYTVSCRMLNQSSIASLYHTEARSQ